MGQQLAAAGQGLQDLPWFHLGFPASPATEKVSGDGLSRSTRLLWGYSCMQGWRDGMEDAHIAMPHLAPPSGSTRGWNDTSVFAVMDGHGGEQVARFCELHLPGEIVKFPNDNITGALRAAYHRMDEMLADPRFRHMLWALSSRGVRPRPVDPSWIGCTAVVCCVRQDSIVVANAGDSRAVLSRDGKAIDMSEDHKPNLPSEFARIEKAGGHVFNERLGPHVLHRVNGDLSLSRSIGDLRYKQDVRLAPEDQIICSTPDIRMFPRHPDDEFMVVACDGVWDVLSSQSVVDYIRPRLMELLSGSLRPSDLVASLLDTCLSPDPRRTFGIGCDNMTMVVVAFAGRPPPLVQEVELPCLLGCRPCKAACA